MPRAYSRDAGLRYSQVIGLRWLDLTDPDRVLSLWEGTPPAPIMVTTPTLSWWSQKSYDLDDRLVAVSGEIVSGDTGLHGAASRRLLPRSGADRRALCGRTFSVAAPVFASKIANVTCLRCLRVIEAVANGTPLADAVAREVDR